MKPTNDGELLAQLRSGIEKATARDGTTVPVYLSNKYFEREMFDDAIAALKRFGTEQATAAALGGTPRRMTGLETLGLLLLMDAAGVDFS